MDIALSDDLVDSIKKSMTQFLQDGDMNIWMCKVYQISVLILQTESKFTLVRR